MDPATLSKPSTPCHLVAMPYPGRGHINPMMNLCKLLSSKVNNNPHLLRVTFVVTEEWLGFIGSETKPANITFVTIPNVLPSELVRAADMRSFLVATQTKMTDPFELLLDRFEVETKSAVNVIVADTFLNWAIDVGNRRGIPVASFWPMSAITFDIFYNFDMVKHNGHHHHPCTDRPEIQEEIIDYIPGISSIRVADLPSFSQQDVFDEFVFPLFPFVNKAQYLLSTSIFELESQVSHSIKQIFPFPVLSIGPLIPYFNIRNSPTRTHDHDYYNWLDNQLPGSVLYVSMGSFLSFSDTQLDEIAAGLNDSGVNYFWVARNDVLKKKENICSSRGLIVPWCDQLQVLSHPSIGGFWTHCGWNSTVEAIYAGVPMLTNPIAIDQFPNSKLIVDDWKIGSRLIEEGKGLLMNRGTIAKIVKEFMDSDREKRKELLRNIKDLQKICRNAVEEDGSSAVNIDHFLSDIGVWSST